MSMPSMQVYNYLVKIPLMGLQLQPSIVSPNSQKVSRVEVYNYLVKIPLTTTLNSFFNQPKSCKGVISTSLHVNGS